MMSQVYSLLTQAARWQHAECAEAKPDGLFTKYFSLQKKMATFKAVCVIKGDVNGVIHFVQEAPDKPTTIKGKIEGLTPGEHGFHVHEWGDTTNGCVSAGAHFNPFKKTHGGPKDDNRHVGDLGNVTADAKGVAEFTITDSQVQLHGDLTVVGRAMVVHAQKDDLGKGGDDESLKTGNAGARVGCGIIGIANPN